jgi:hypothetical protein
MSFREIAGLLLLIAGVAIVPLGWIVNHKLSLVAGVLLFVGGWLFYTERALRRKAELAREDSGGGSYGPDMPGDIHNYTGWRTGGRTEPFDSFSESSDSGGDGSAGD